LNVDGRIISAARAAMQQRKIPINLWNLVFPLAKTFDLMNPVLGDHSLRVAYLAMRLAEELEWPAWRRREAAIAGALHDIGAFSLAERLDLMEFETADQGTHAIAGHLLLREFKPFERIAEAVLHHHLHWRNGEGESLDGVPIPEISHILHLADRTAVLFRKDEPILGQIPGIRDSIRERSGSWFVPAYVDAFLRLCDRDYIWMEIASGSIGHSLRVSLGTETVDTDMREFRDFARLVCRVIDFKSEFTATHSSGVAAVAEALASLVGFSRQECVMFEIAAYLHDLGKLAIPSEILEKRDRLTKAEWGVMRTHAYYTYQILNPIEVLNLVSSWSSLHQERLDGSGYPFHLGEDDLPLGARLMAVADVFTGITENRPYRKGMTREEALGVLHEMSTRELDPRLVSLLESHYDSISHAREEAQAQAIHEYETFRKTLGDSAKTGSPA
jgi:HD-GYP domain-containing protein (c-di-GMP phosphodiesterase class II)